MKRRSISCKHLFEKCLRDAEKENKPELIETWKMIKEDEQSHLKMLLEELILEVKENKLK